MPAGLDGNPNPLMTVERSAVLSLLADAAVAVRAATTLVAVDGASGTGKPTLADEIAEMLAGRDHQVVRASVDSFHRPAVERYRRGPDSPEGYYLDSHNLVTLQDRMLIPFRRGAGRFVTAVFDEPSDQPIDGPSREVPAGSTLIVDGLFLHRPELVGYWDLGVYLVAEARREWQWQDYLTTGLPADPVEQAEEVRSRVAHARRRRYVEGQRLYERQACPAEHADFVIDNDDLAHPKILHRRDCA